MPERSARRSAVVLSPMAAEAVPPNFLLRVGGLGDDVDDTAEGRPPGRGGGPLDDLDPLDLLDRERADVGEVVGKVVDGDPVHHDPDVARIRALNICVC